MSKVFAVSTDVSKSPLNSSKSKQLFSFPKSPRFDKPKILNDRFYDFNTTLSSRAPGIGVGDRFFRSLTSIFQLLSI